MKIITSLVLAITLLNAHMYCHAENQTQKNQSTNESASKLVPEKPINSLSTVRSDAISRSAAESIKNSYLDKFLELKYRDKIITLGTFVIFCLVIFGLIRYFLTGKQ